MSVEQTCSDFAAGRLEPSNTHQVLRQLSSEWDKRLEGWIFERVFDRHLANAVGDENISRGWLFMTPGGRPKHAFQIVQEEEGEVAHAATAMYLQRRGCTVTRIDHRAGATALAGSSFAAERWEPWQPLPEVLERLTGRRKPPPRYDDADRDFPDRMTKALDYIRREFSPEETRNLAIHRLLINCYLYRWFEFQPVDVDAVVLVRDILHFVEFKQKYPYRLREGTPVGLFVGLDESHQGLLVWLEEGRTPYVHVVLSNPLWSRFKNESPLHLLAGGSVTLPHATWMGGRLTRASFDPRAARIVHGADAGRRSGRRSLGAINVERFRELGTGSTPSLLSKLLFDGDDTLRIVLTSALQERNKQGEKDYLAWNAGT